jgi:hypothetical protein
VLAASKDQVKAAPNVESGEGLSDREQEALRRYYIGWLSTAGRPAGGRAISVASVPALALVTNTLPIGLHSSPLSGCPFTVIIRSGSLRIVLSSRPHGSLLS